MENEKKTLYTEEGYKNLVDELQYLKDVRIPEIKVQIAEARAFGDLSENSEYDEAKNEQAQVEGRIAELESILKNAQVLECACLTSGGEGVTPIYTFIARPLKKSTTPIIMNKPIRKG